MENNYFKLPIHPFISFYVIRGFYGWIFWLIWLVYCITYHNNIWWFDGLVVNKLNKSEHKYKLFLR